jgi:DNA-binding CsgD family transcriptional regulator/N-acetylneuraminic acid mutarotase
MGEATGNLSEREIEIIKLVATGASNKEIALALQISPNTVKVHLRNIFSKIEVVSRTEATLYAIRNNFISPPASSPIPETLADEVIFSSSPLAMAADPIATPVSQTKPGFPILPTLVSIASFIIIVLLITALIFSRQSPPKSSPLVSTPTAIERWNFKKPIPKPLSGSSSIAFNGRIYLIGGHIQNQSLDQLLEYNPTLDSWSNLQAKPTPVSDTQAVLIQEKIYIPGGKLSDGKPSNRLETYNFQTRSWETHHPLPISLYGSGIATLEGNLYVFGGWDGKQFSHTVYIYTPATDSWSEGAGLPAARAYLATAVVESHIFLIGGENDKGPTSEVLIYYPSRDSTGGTAYEIGKSLPHARSKLSAVAIANTVYLFGGNGNGDSSSDPIVFDSDHDIWYPLNPPSQAIGESPAVVTAGNFIHVLGGRLSGIDQTSHQAYQAIYTITIPLTTNN